MSEHRFLFERNALLEIASSLRAEYVSADPFPHAVVDDLLPHEVLWQALSEFPGAADHDWIKHDKPTSYKLAASEEWTMGPSTRHLLRQQLLCWHTA